jgi:hypothetical protein
MAQPPTAIVTGTKYLSPEKGTDKVRFMLAQELVADATRLGYPVYCVDFSPYPMVAETLVRLGATVCTPNHGGEMGPCRAQAMRQALAVGFDFYVWTEPEKKSIPGFLEGITVIMDRGGLDIAMLGRSLDGFRSHPEYMMNSELQGNWAINSVLGMTIDWFMGPQVMRKAGAENFAKAMDDPAASWDRLMVSAIRGMRSGLKMGSVILPPYRYPAEQTVAEEQDEAMKTKRKKQQTVLVEGILKEWNTPPTAS